MKKVVKLSLVLLMAICIMGNVYAATSCNVSVQTAKSEYSKNEQFTVDVNIANIQSDRGIISLGATLEYDKNSLTLVKMEGKNGWETPSSGTSYNEANGKIAITRNGLGKNNETVFTITFKVKEQSKQNLAITLKDITVADGTKPAKIATTYKNITIKEGTVNPNPKPGTDGSDKNQTTTPEANTTPETNTSTGTNANTTTGTSTNKGTNSSTSSTATNKSTSTKSSNKNAVKSGSLPKAGSLGTIAMIPVVIIAVVAVIFFIKMKKINKDLNK